MLLYAVFCYIITLTIILRLKEQIMSEKNKKEYDRCIAIAAGGKGMNGEIKRLDEIEPLKIEHVEIDNSALSNFDYPVFNEEEAYKIYLLEKESIICCL